MQDIYFYSRKENEYGFLSNFWRAYQEVNNFIYPTNENYYQSKKSASWKLEEWIADAPTPYAAMKAGRALRKGEMVENWDDKKVDIMYNGLVAKFTQNGNLKKKLLATGDARLHEDSPSDMFWGVKGKDMLGKLLMKVREEIRSGKI